MWQAVDSDNITFGARHVRLDADAGLFLNGRPVQYYDLGLIVKLPPTRLE